MESSLFYLNNFVFALDKTSSPLRHTWSLAVEEHFYIIFPLLLVILSVGNVKRLFKWYLFTIPIQILIITMGNFDFQIINKFTNFRIASIILGCLIALHQNKLTKLKINFVFILFMIYTILVVVRFSSYDNFTITARYVLSMLFSSITLLYLLNLENEEVLLSKFLKSDVLKFIGNISYGIYLYHLPILFYFGVSFTQNYNSISIWNAFVYLGLIILIPIISFYFFEKPINKLRKHFLK